jgi:hypothetical protein
MADTEPKPAELIERLAELQRRETVLFDQYQHVQKLLMDVMDEMIRVKRQLSMRDKIDAD